MAEASSYNPAYITANGGTPGSAFSALLAGFDAGKAYLNIHTSFKESGEIRGFLTPEPEPTGGIFVILGLTLAATRRTRVKS